MQSIKRIAAVLCWPAIACLGVACDRMDTPMEPQASAEMLNSSSPHTHWVNNEPGSFYFQPGTSCNHPGYPTIQSAVNAAGPGDHINVCPGVYPEQVTIPAGKDGIRLRSTRQWAAVIKAPPIMIVDPGFPAFTIVRVHGARNVTILAFTITGPGPGPCESLHYGVRVRDNGSAEILGNHIVDIRDQPFSGCQNGVAILVGRQVDATTGSAKIMGNVIERYQKNGPTIDNAGSYAEIAHNRILGAGPTAVIAQNGVQVSRGATADIRHNFVSGHVYTPQAVAASGVLLFGPGKVITDHNTVTLNDVSIWMIGTATGSMTAHNRVKASTYDGVALEATGNRVAHNKTEHNSGPGIGMYDAQDNSVDYNKVEDNDDSGILLDDADNNSVGNNQVRRNGTAAGGDVTDGIRVNTGSLNNTVHNNHLRDNVTHDCHDENTVGNNWDGNHGETSQPPGLCGEADEASFTTSTAYGWDAAYPWYDAFDVAAEFDWAAAYATIDTESLLELLPAIRVGGIRRAPASPNQ